MTYQYYNAVIPYETPKPCKYSEEGLEELVTVTVLNDYSRTNSLKTYPKRLEKKRNRRGVIVGERGQYGTDSTMYVVLWENNIQTHNVAKDYIEII